MPFPPPDEPHPVILSDGTCHRGTVFLSAVIDHPAWSVGAYSYASAHAPVDDWAHALAPYLFDTSAERLIIGKFCQIAHGVQFITSSANHRMDGISTYPFAIFDGMDPARPSMPPPGADTVVGNDVWIGTGALILPGAHISSGAIIGAGAVVAGVVPEYSVVVGNPARIQRYRFEPQVRSRIHALAWWDWPIEKILAHEGAIFGGDIDHLEKVALD